MVIQMVNANKHKQKQYFISEQQIQDIEIQAINELNNGYDEMIRTIESNNGFYNKHKKSLFESTNGSYLPLKACKVILLEKTKLMLWLDIIETNYHALKLNDEQISIVKSKIMNQLDIIDEIKILQNRNIDDGFMGFASIISSELVNNMDSNYPMDYYLSKEFEDIMRLKTEFEHEKVKL